MITGRIESWEVYAPPHSRYPRVRGYLFEDVHKRWADGAPIVTSELLPMSMQISLPKEGVIVHTRNSAYLLGKPKGESCE